jgi:type IV pilus assembly protein PilC
MALILTPGQLSQLSEFYRQLSTLTQAGLGLTTVLRQISAHPPNRDIGRIARQLQSRIAEGTTLTEAFRSLRPALPAFDVAFIEAGEQGGRLDACFQMLANHYEVQAQTARSTITDLLYPAFLLHFAVFILPFSEFFTTGNLLRYLMKTGGMLLPLYAVFFAVIYACQATHGEAWRARLEQIYQLIPVLGAARKKLALARLAAALEALINAGVPVFRAWELAGEASGSPALRRIIAQWPPLFAVGQTPAEVIRNSPAFPQLFANLYHSGEISGRLDQELRHLHILLLEEGTRQMQAFWSWMPKIVYLVIALVIAYKVISFYAGYFAQINQLM